MPIDLLVPTFQRTNRCLTRHCRVDVDDRPAGGHPHGVAAAASTEYAKAAAADDDDDCSEGVVQVSQVNAGPLPSGIPSYSVTITNTCLDCTVRDVHVSCGEFASTVLVDPSSFRRLAYGDCLVGDGGPIGPGETVCFEYSNSFIYSMDVASVSCGDI
ncbi:TPD1 protein homolog 1B-like [Panicum virgatum]|uniref:TPD1 protein homolog 1B-like n=1 Tax=Panicum virgatum TaxID=38727 RepID=UPI0019D6235F|nr:TPD1 protein homolog 1B-like [Panicum virgatum]